MRNILKTIMLMLLCIRVNAQAPAVTLPSFAFFKLDQTSFSNKDLDTQKKNFFIFFDPDCEHCQHAITNINKQFNDFKYVNMYLISMENKVKVSVFLKTYASNLSGKKNVTVLLDPKNDFLTRFMPRRYPAMYLYSKDGKLLTYEDNEDNVFRVVKIINNPIAFTYRKTNRYE